MASVFLYNVHTPSKTFSLTYKDGEGYAGLIDRIVIKAGLDKPDAESVRRGKDGAGLVYEFDGARWSLEDDDDLQILRSRLPPSTTPSATLHLTPPGAHAAAPPAYSTASIKTKPKKPKSTVGSSPAKHLNGTSGGNGNGNGIGASPTSPTSGEHVGFGADVKDSSALAPPARGEHLQVVAHTDAKSVRSTKSRRSKWGDDDAEPLGEVHKRAWHEFHDNQGVRTVLGKVGAVDNVRMLLKPGYRNVYVSRAFAVENGLVDKKYGMGHAGYAGLRTLGNVPITVAGRTMSHPAMINEEMHFDVVLGRTWVEKMNVKIDPLDQTILTYMDTGEPIPCDIVVLRDAAGSKIHIT
ncbi:hypothetical protein EHS25_002208 [Saitozyma podzolica]|uniref:Uncharacterized protein n=1 Tax=Saitozyma podzolica TaxID=1890683 RepID=A0A427YFA3_9TREE|nr:hypothetical protein EHS25_002208 [Saitozyma podzolica]